MKDYQVSNHNLQAFMEEIQAEISEHKLLIVSAQPAGTGKWGMARLWRMWMVPTAKYMNDIGVFMYLAIDKNGKPFGRRKFTPEDAHEMYTRCHLGVDANDNRLSWAKSSKDKDKRIATKGERFNALRKHELWALERAIILFKPRGSEYDQLTQEQDK